MMQKARFTRKSWEGARKGCQCGRCSCIELQEDRSPMTMAESWLTKRTWPEDHDDYDPRMNFIRTFGFAILTGSTVQMLREYSPILEVGAGTGYWTMELEKAGTDIVATDPMPGMFFERAPIWTQVEMLGGAEAMEKHPGRNLMLCWPDRERWPGEVLEECSSKYIIYVGEPRNGCTGNDRMFDLLESRYRLKERIEIPRFREIHDWVEIWRRR